MIGVTSGPVLIDCFLSYIDGIFHTCLPISLGLVISHRELVCGWYMFLLPWGCSGVGSGTPRAVWLRELHSCLPFLLLWFPLIHLGGSFPGLIHLLGLISVLLMTRGMALGTL